MEIQTIIDTYRRYLDTFKDGNADIFTNYGKITDFIDTNCKGSDELAKLNSSLSRHCIGKNIWEIRNKNIKVKAHCTDGWSTVVVEHGYKLLKAIKSAERVGDSNAYKVNLRNFYDLANNQKPHLQLYLYLCYADRIGNGLFSVSWSEIEEAARRAIAAE